MEFSDRLIFMVEIHLLVRRHPFIETDPWITPTNYPVMKDRPEARSVAPRKARYLAFLRSETNRCYAPRSRDLDI